MKKERRYHVNGLGRVGLCAAVDRPCPFGGENAHFPTKEKAEKYAAKIMRDKYGTIPKDRVIRRYETVKSDKDREYVAQRLSELKMEREDNTYAERCNTSEALVDYNPSNYMTWHMRMERLDKERGLIKEFGKGKVVGYYKVYHLNDDKNPRWQYQVTEIWDNGRISMYDYEQGHGKKVTTFAAHRARVEAIMLMAGQIPDEDLLDDITNNRERASQVGLS